MRFNQEMRRTFSKLQSQTGSRQKWVRSNREGYEMQARRAAHFKEASITRGLQAKIGLLKPRNVMRFKQEEQHTIS